jgi:hypothetical protein
MTKQLQDHIELVSSMENRQTKRSIKPEVVQSAALLLSPHRAIQGLFELIPMKEFPMGIQISSDKVIQMVMARKPDAVIIGNAGWGSCAAASGGAAAKLEKLGIPTVIIQRKELMEATRQAVMGQGFAPEAPWVVFNYHLFCWKRRQPS